MSVVSNIRRGEHCAERTIEVPRVEAANEVVESIIRNEIAPFSRLKNFEMRRWLTIRVSHGSLVFTETNFELPVVYDTMYYGYYMQSGLCFAIEASALRYFKEKGSSVLFSYLYYTSEGLIFTHPLEWSFKIAGDRYIPAESNPDLEEIAAR